MKRPYFKILMFIVVLQIIWLSPCSAIDQNLMKAYSALNTLKKSLIAQENYDKAIEFLQEFTQKNPNTYLADVATIEIGNIYFLYLKDYRKALEHYVPVAQRNQNKELTAQVQNKIKEVQKSLTITEMNLIEIALDKYYVDQLSFPVSLTILKKDGYINDERILNDSWGEDYSYKTLPVDFLPSVEHQKYILLSKGPDRREGTLDDIDVMTSPKDPEILEKENKESQKEKYPLRLKNVFQGENKLKAVIYSVDATQKYTTVQEGDIVNNVKILGIRPEGIVVYTPEEEAIFIPLKNR